ncbi:MAG: 30S ribosomal protein S9 [archaeon]|jgi:small subunit ribosomal protein S9
MTNEITQETIVEKKKIKPATKKAGMQVSAKKKTAVARAMIKKGTGKVKINHINLEAYAQDTLRSMIKEPLKIAEEVAGEFDINVTVKGSGSISQAFAVRSVIAKAIVRAKGKKFKDLFLLYDRTLLVDDVRRVESKKPLGTKARAKKQQSKR